jgi:hypothetical protein
MSLPLSRRGFRAATAMLACAALAMSPALADAAGKSKHSKKKKPAAELKQAKRTKPSHTANSLPALGSVGPAAPAQLDALRSGIAAAPGHFGERATGCASITPVLVNQPGQTIGGNFRDSADGCYVWLNLSQSAMLTAPEICKTALHEVGHLMGMEHSADPSDVMYTPFTTDPIPRVCLPK